MLSVDSLSVRFFTITSLVFAWHRYRKFRSTQRSRNQTDPSICFSLGFLEKLSVNVTIYRRQSYYCLS